MAKEVITENPVKISYEKNWILADLAEQEKNLLINRGGVISTGNLGYIDPSKVVKYFSSKLDKTFSGSLDLNVYIDFEEDWKRLGIAGRYYFFTGDLKKHEESDIILSGPILASDIKQKKINLEYVREDNSGRIIPITEKRIESEIARIEKEEIIASYSFTKIERLSKIIGTDYSKKINQLKESTQRNILKRYSSRENLESVLDRLELTTECNCVSLFPEDDMPESPDLEILDEFLKFLPKIDLSSDIKERTITFLNEYAQSHDPYITEAEEKIKEDTGYLESLEKEQQHVRGLVCQLRNKK